MPLCNDCGDWGEHKKFIPKHLLLDTNEKGVPKILYYVCPNCSGSDITPSTVQQPKADKESTNENVVHK